MEPPRRLLETFAWRASEIDPRTDANRSGLVGKVRDTGAKSSLPVQREKRLLVGEVVDEEGSVPLPFQDAQPQVDDVVRRHLRIEGDEILRVRTADIVRCEGHQTLSRWVSEVFVTDLREAIADMLVDAGQVPDEALHLHP